jgi:hypothetical protein
LPILASIVSDSKILAVKWESSLTILYVMLFLMKKPTPPPLLEVLELELQYTF